MDQSPIPLPLNCITLCAHIKAEGGTAYLVGGIVRDHILGLPAKDYDIEVHELSKQKLLSILKCHGSPKAVGKSFGIWKMVVEKIEYDISLPKINGSIDIHLGLHNACRRRDLRINAMAYDPIAEQFHDPFNGISDLQNKKIHATDPIFFAQDPLRVLRVAQMASRFQFSIGKELSELCKKQPLKDIAPERVSIEIEKNWLKSSLPSVGIQHFNDLLVFKKYFPNWPGISQHSVLQSLDRGKNFCSDYIGWNMGLFWALALQKCSLDEAEAILDTLQIYTYHGFNIRDAVLCSLRYSKRLSEQKDSVLRNHVAEEFRLDFLCSVATSIYPRGLAVENLQQAKSEGIERNSVPKLIQGRDLLKLGYSGKQLGQCLQRIRSEQLHNKIKTSQQALTLAKEWLAQ